MKNEINSKFEEQLKQLKQENEKLHEQLFESEKREEQYKQNISLQSQDWKNKEENYIKE